VVKYKNLYFLLSLFTCFSFACNSVDPVHKQPYQVMQADRKLNFKKSGYHTEKVFIYQVTSHNKVDTLALYCSPLQYDNLQYRAEWAFLTLDDQRQWRKDSTRQSTQEGIAVTDSVLFLHPPRFSYLKYTQFLPYPYFEHESTEWEWDFNIGKLWEIPGSYPIDSLVTLHISYKSDSQFRSGQPPIYTVEAVSKSLFGTATASFVLEENTGIVSMDFVDHQQRKLSFILLEKNTDHTALWKKNVWLAQSVARFRMKEVSGLQRIN
jgi:hypothetical protein